MKLFVDPDDADGALPASPAWLKRLMDAWADGLNFYLFMHPDVHPRVIPRFEPWMALLLHGGEHRRRHRASIAQACGVLRARTAPAPPRRPRDPIEEPTGSNGIAIAPTTARRPARCWINPHTSFYFRSELQMVSDEGLDAYGAATWGQFFIYQGFNAHNGGCTPRAASTMSTSLSDRLRDGAR